MTLVLRHGTRVFSWLFLALGGLLLVGSASLWGFERWVEMQAARPVSLPAPPSIPKSFAAIPPEALDADATSALTVIARTVYRQPVAPPEPATRVVIPKIDVDSRVVELNLKQDDKGEWIWETPDHAVGHLIGTGLPGQSDNI